VSNRTEANSDLRKFHNHSLLSLCNICTVCSMHNNFHSRTTAFCRGTVDRNIYHNTNWPRYRRWLWQGPSPSQTTCTIYSQC